ncbi:MAG: hypothetical protein N2234_01125 [Planctomycetota bacterium]|nr:hypothetical protein [Planctomycetota bacterium]
MAVVFALLGVVFAFLAGAEGGKLGSNWWQMLGPGALPLISLALAFLFFSIAASVPSKPLSQPWRYELLMLGCGLVFVFSIVYAVTHPERVDEQVFALVGAEAVSALIVVILFFTMKSGKMWKLAIPAIILIAAGMGGFWFAFLG